MNAYRTFTVLLLALVSDVHSACPPVGPSILDEEQEVLLAMSAAPAALAQRAGVYVLKEDGYRKVRDSSNGFNCIVERSHPLSSEPQCLDAEGSETILPQILYAAELRVQGKTEHEVKQLIAQGYASGRFRAPRRPGINYMLSEDNCILFDPDNDVVGHYPPHLMFYAPFQADEDIGGVEGSSNPMPAFIINDGEPTAYIIVPVSWPPGS